MVCIIISEWHFMSSSSSIYVDMLTTKDQKNPALSENCCDIMRIELSCSRPVFSLNPVSASPHSQRVGRARWYFYLFWEITLWSVLKHMLSLISLTNSHIIKKTTTNKSPKWNDKYKVRLDLTTMSNFLPVHMSCETFPSSGEWNNCRLWTLKHYSLFHVLRKLRHIKFWLATITGFDYWLLLLITMMSLMMLMMLMV